MRGIISVLNTPFTVGDGIDVSGLRRNVLNAVEAGVAGFLVPALAGEVGSLSQAERSLLVETVLDAVAGRVPVVGGVYAETQVDRLRAVRELTAMGCAGVLVNMRLADERTFEDDLRALGDVGPGFIMLQDWDPVGTGLPLALIVRLFERVPSFQWLKVEVNPAGPKYTAVLDATDGRLQVAGGWAVMQMIEGLDRGVHAFMPTGMHWIYTRIYTLYVSGDRDGARALFERVLPVLAFSNQRLDVSVCFFKRLLHAQGVYATARVRMEGAGLDGVQARIADELVERVMEIEAGLGGMGEG